MRCGWGKRFASSSAAALALAFASSAHAAPQLADARAWYVVNGTNGDILAAHDASAVSYTHLRAHET